MRGRRTLDDLSDESEVADAIRDLSKQADDKPVPTDFELPTERILEFLNARRKRLVLKTFTPQSLGSVLGDLGFKRDVDYRKAKSGPNRDKNVLLPERFLRELAQPAQPAQETLDGAGSRDEKPESGAHGPDGPDGPEPPQGTADGPEPIRPKRGPVMEESGNWTVPARDREKSKEGEP